MKYRYIQIFSFLVALLSFSIFSACEVDDKIVFVQDKVNPPSQSEEMSFSVSESKQVCFSKGNLQYHPANNEWRFAESQLDYIGDANINISATYNGWLDLFGWSTSATNFGVSTSTNDNDYSGDFVDWGTNQIGSDAPNTWRTLSNDEWDYLLNTRTNADALRGVAQVNGVNGLVFLPDSWTCPEGVTFKSGFNSEWSTYGQYQTFTAEQWSLLESAGAIFLPAAGSRYGSDVRYVQNHGNYWSATENSFWVYSLDFYSDEAYVYGNNRDDGFSVRLVKDLLPVVTTSTITQITETTAVAGGNVTSDGNASVTERGVCVATASNPTTSNTKITAGSGTGSFTCNLTGLQPNTTYYVRAYAINSKGTAYGEEVSFTTKEESNTPSNGTENGYGYVDLGLSVKWATCNVGATKPEEYGDYFAWGETQPKSTYNWSTYKWCNGSYNTQTKYCTDSYYGTVDNKTQLELSDDAARANWGGSWRMPTDAELTELRENCTWTWTTQNGVYGYKVTSKKSGYTNKSIFLPAAGYRDSSGLNDAGSYGDYWSSSLGSGDPYGAYALDFYSGNVGWGSYYRCYGRSVRPVLGESEKEVTDPTVTTAAITQITETTAVAGGSVTSDGNASVTERGVVYSTNPNPVITNLYNTIKPCGSGTGSFTCDLTNLQPNTTYYVRAYATNEKGTAYGEEVSFTTEEEVVAIPEYVDLGLSVKWATCNVGASQPEEYGDYFAWGETEPKSTYDWSTYKYCNGSETTLTKYCTDSNYGRVDNKTTLELSDDAAYVNWGGSWRMPTDAELTELREQCTWTWTTQNGVNGYKATSKSNGNSIFLPAAGYRGGSSSGGAGSNGFYWSSSLHTDSPYRAYALNFGSADVYRTFYNRYYGLSVRPVCP